jgi:sensor domain CHASE-containing protein
MATVESWVKGHEKICGDRYRLLMAVISIGCTIIIGVGAWGLNQVHEDQRAQIALLQNVSQQVSATRQQPVTVQMNQRP